MKTEEERKEEEGEEVREELEKNAEHGEALGAPAVLDLEDLRQLVDQRTGHNAEAQELAQQHLQAGHVCRGQEENEKRVAHENQMGLEMESKRELSKRERTKEVVINHELLEAVLTHKFNEVF